MKTIVALLALLALCLGALAWLTFDRQVAEPLVPDPENVVQDFIRTLSAGRYAPAQQSLSDELQAEFSEEELQKLHDALQETFGAYRFEPQGELEEQSDEATYYAHIKTEQRGTQTIAFELERDQQTGLWKISSLEELQQAPQQK